MLQTKSRSRLGVFFQIGEKLLFGSVIITLLGTAIYEVEGFSIFVAACGLEILSLMFAQLLLILPSLIRELEQACLDALSGYSHKLRSTRNSGGESSLDDKKSIKNNNNNNININMNEESYSFVESLSPIGRRESLINENRNIWLYADNPLDRRKSRPSLFRTYGNNNTSQHNLGNYSASDFRAKRGTFEELPRYRSADCLPAKKSNIKDKNTQLINRSSLIDSDEESIEFPLYHTSYASFLRNSSISSRRRNFKSKCHNILTRVNYFTNTHTRTLASSRAAYLALLARTAAWSCVWVWATTFMDRDPKNKKLTAWTFGRVPQAYYYVEGMFLWSVTLDYCFGLILTTRRFKYLFCLTSLIDLVTMPVANTIINGIVVGAARSSGNDSQSRMPWMLLLGYLRFLRLVKTEAILSHSFPSMKTVTLRVIAIVTTIITIVLTFAGCMYILEAPEPEESYTTVFDFFYYAVVTISTVGYGDFSPSSTAGRTVAILAIVVTLSYVPGEIQRLTDALRTPPSILGPNPAIGEDYICLIGPLPPLKLVSLIKQVYYAFPGSLRRVVLITPLPVASYALAAKTLLRKASIRITVKAAFSGSNFSPRRSAQIFANARGLFVFGSVYPSEQLPFALDVIEEEQDQMTLLRFFGVRGACWPFRPISLELFHESRRSLVLDMGAYNVICLNELKMRMMGRSQGDCPGCVTLISNWYHQTFRELSKGSPLYENSDPDWVHYTAGATYQIYRLEFPTSFHGIQFHRLVRLFYRCFRVFLLGIISIDQGAWLNPESFIIGEELSKAGKWPFAGIVLAPSLEIVVRLSAGFGATLRSSTPRLQEESQPNPALLPGPRVKKSEESLERAFLLKQPPLPNSQEIGGLHSVHSAAEARRLVFRNPDNNLLLVCGWPRGLSIFLQTMRSTTPRNVIILAPSPPQTSLPLDYQVYSESCCFIQGSGLSVDDLIRGGLLGADRVCVFSCNHVKYKVEGASKFDVQTVLVRKTIQTVLQSHASRFELSDSSPLAKNLNSSVSRNFDPTILIHLKETAFLYYMEEGDASVGTEVHKDRNDPGNIWTGRGPHYATKEFAAGRVFVEDMFDGLIAYSLPVSRYAVDASVISQLTGSSVASQLNASGSMVGRNTLTLNRTGANELSRLTLMPVPTMLVNMTFERVFSVLLRRRNLISVGIYRVETKDTRELVISCPSADMKVEGTDKVYVITGG